MITKIETAMIDRLRQGLGDMVRTVKGYRGELDDMAVQMTTLPAVWVSYGGSRIDTKNTAQGRFADHATFVVLCATRNLRGDSAARQGGETYGEIGSNQLIAACRRLLDAQRLGVLADSHGLTPQNVRSLLNNQIVQAQSLSVFAIEYLARFDSFALENDRYPEPQTDPTHPDYVFSAYRGRLSPPYPDLLGVEGRVFDPADGAAVNVDIRLP